MSTTRVTRRIEAPPARVYAALLDPDAVQRWMVPDGMTSEVHAFDAREAGAFRISLTYEEPTAAGKTSAPPTRSTAGSCGWCPTARSCRRSSSNPTTRRCRAR